MARKKNDKKPGKSGDNPNFKTVCRNRKARHLYDILDELECGIVLRGSEVKSIRNGKLSIEEAYARITNGELWLFNLDISEYPQATVMNHEPKRTRKLLVHRRELRKFAESATHDGLTMVPLSIYFTRGKIKVKIALARGRKLHDKREKLRTKTDKRDMRTAMMTRKQ